MPHHTAQVTAAATLWAKLPPETACALLFSGDGEAHLTREAERLLDALGNNTDPALTAVFVDIALAAWETALLYDRPASVVAQIHALRPFLAGQAAAFCSQCATLRPENSVGPLYVNAALRSGDIDAAKKLITRHAAGKSDNLFWLRCAALLGIHLGELDWYEPWLAKLPMPGAFAFVFLADYAFAREEWSKAADLYAGAFARSNMPGWLVREGECRRRLGDRESARALWRRALAVRPWQINLLLRLRDLERGSDIPGDPPPGRGEILLYSWNHEPDLDKALAALAASALGGCGLTVLDNGSSDNTPAVIRSWQERFGGRMKTLALPVNVGAPAARNWLLSLESSKAADWVVFLDDDALVPPDWLGYFGTALRLHPEAGIVGCRVVSTNAPMAMQSVDLHFERAAPKAQEPPKPDPQDERTSRFSGGDMVNTHLTVPDFGQYKYLRTAVSVTGCCHLLTRENLEDVGHFDLRFSPSQFDDLERDLRSCLKGKFCLYQGHLVVRHSKRSGVAARISLRQQANVTGNLSKLWASYTPEQLGAIVKEDLRRLREDLTTEQFCYD